jgi:Tfp pilus assembly protein PilF
MQKAAALSPENPDVHNNLGMTLRDFGRLEEAEASFLCSLQIKPDNAEVHNNLGITLLDMGRLEEAGDCFIRALQLNPDYAEAHNNLGISLMDRGLFKEAEASYRRALQIKPDNAEAHNNLGIALLDIGRLEEAEASYRRALQIKPDYAEAHNNLGTPLRDQGRMEEAGASYRHALQIKPDYAEAHYNLGITLLDQGRLEEAEASYRRALQIKPDYAEAHNNFGTTLRDMGRLDEAEASYRRVLEISPDYADAHYNLGIILRDMGRLDEAEASYRYAIEIKPGYAEAHNNLGVTLHDLGRLGEAEGNYRSALKINPDYAEAHNNLGNTLLDLSRLDEAEASYRRAIEIKPGLADAHSNLGSALITLGKMGEAEKSLNKAIELAPGEAKPLATAFLYIPYRQDDPRFNQLEAVYAKRQSLPLEERIKLNFAMGKAMENIGQYDRSFSAYEEGNRLQYQKHPFDEAGDENFLEKSCSLFTADLFKECAVLANTLPAIQDERVPIFIVGMLRSGTTLIEQILASHPAIFGAGELTTFKAVLLPRDSTSAEDALLALRKLGQEYLDHVWKLAPDARYITDKLPGNYCHLGLIHMMLPNSKIIHAMRDPMDTCFSCYALRFTHGHEYCYDLGALGRQYLRYSKLMKHWHNVLPPDRILDVRYEDIVADPEREARRMLDYLGLTWDSACLRFHENRRAVHTASVTQVRKPIYSNSVARWKYFEKYLGPLLETVNPTASPACDD